MKDQNLSRLDDFHVDWNRISIEEPRLELAKYVLQKMCDVAVEGLWIQRGNEYGFFGDQFNERATIVSEMSGDDLVLIRSHNLDCERDLAVSDILIENTISKLDAHLTK